MIGPVARRLSNHFAVVYTALPPCRPVLSLSVSVCLSFPLGDCAELPAGSASRQAAEDLAAACKALASSAEFKQVSAVCKALADDNAGAIAKLEYDVVKAMGADVAGLKDDVAAQLAAHGSLEECQATLAALLAEVVGQATSITKLLR